MEQNKQAPTLYVRYDIVYSDGSRQHGWTEVKPGESTEDIERVVASEIDGWYGTGVGAVEAHYREYGHLCDVPVSSYDETLDVIFY